MTLKDDMLAGLRGTGPLAPKTMTNDEIRKMRVALGLSQQELATHAGITHGAMNSIEAGRGTRDGLARAKVEASLRQLLAPKEKPDNGPGTNGPPRGRKATDVRQRPEHLVSTTEWNGMKPGHRFVVEGIEGSFTFIEHVTNTQRKCEWVTGYGGTAGFGITRSFNTALVQSVGGA